MPNRNSKLQFFGIRIRNNEEFENLVKSRLQALYRILRSQSEIKAPMMHMRSKAIYTMCEKFAPTELSKIANDFALSVFDHPIRQAYREGGSRFGQSIRPYWTTKKAIAAKKSTYKAGVSGQRWYRLWTPEETKELLDLYEMYGSNWSLIAERMTTERSAESCRCRYDRIAERIDSSLPKREKRIYVKWTPEENGNLIELFKKGADWETIALAIGRSVHACHRQYERLEERIDSSLPKRERIRGKWTPEEDEKLMNLHDKYGHIKRGKWPKIAQSMGKSIKSVQERFYEIKNRTSRTM